jgi:phosphotriesterase-related protein
MELADAHAAGTQTVVDLTTFDLGRRPAALRRISEATGVDIVMGTGWYTSSTYPDRIGVTPTNQLADELIEDITVGVDGIRPGVIGEIGTADIVIEAREERVIRAVARAQLTTGLPVFIHQQRVFSGPAVLELLREEGVAAPSVIFCHMDSLDDPDAHAAALDLGVWLSYDRLQGWDLIHQLRPWEVDRRVELVLGARRGGFLDRIVLSTDCCVLGDLARYGGPGYAYTHATFAQRLLDEGLGAAELDQLFVDNPRRILAGAPAPAS